MKYFLISVLLSLSFFFKGEKNPDIQPYTKEEEALFQAITEYRKSLGMPKIGRSSNLDLVAQAHAEDLRDNPPMGNCNMHSWSGRGKGKKCCYTSDHKNPECMWQKPSELSHYKGKGFEIAAMNTANEVDWLAQWKKSTGHHQVIINAGVWKKMEWKAMGLAIRKPYAVVWFGVEEDLN
jgi:uncharacterized protein YkwD